MKIGLLVTFIGNFGQKGFYNSQEIGLAKALSPFCEQIHIYKLSVSSEREHIEKVSGFDNISISVLPAKNFGANGLFDVNALDNSMDALVCFSDTQFAVPKVYKWAVKNNIQFIPYVGVVKSHSPNLVKRLIVDFLFWRNVSVYKKCACLVKNEDVEKELCGSGVKAISLAPVGVDFDLLNSNYKDADKTELKVQYGFGKDDKLILFVGRLVEEKRPVELINYFSKLHEKNSNYKLLIVGKGVLNDEMHAEISRLELNDCVKHMEQFPNEKIWELYRIADCFVNLNKQEIFGMVLLEAMYYETKVVAWHAPGPDYIIEDGVSGYLVSNEHEFLEKIELENEALPRRAHERIVKHMSWDKTAKEIIDIIEKRK